MTIQIKHFIDLTDLLALRFTCKECGSTLSVPLSDAKLTHPQNTTFLANCPSCNSAWAEVKGSVYEPIITKATAALNRLKETMHGETSAPLGFSLMLEIKPEAVSNPRQ